MCTIGLIGKQYTLCSTLATRDLFLLYEDGDFDEKGDFTRGLRILAVSRYPIYSLTLQLDRPMPWYHRRCVPIEYDEPYFAEQELSNSIR